MISHNLDPAAVAASIATVPGVARLGAGLPGEPSTPGIGSTVQGVAERGQTLAVSVVAEAGWPLPELAERIRDAAHWDGPVHVDIVDLVDPADRVGMPASVDRVRLA